MLKYLLLLLFVISLNANSIKIASYNVENFFDLEKNNSEYEEYIPNTSSLWNQNSFDVKISNLVKVIEDLDADIIALQEIENRELLQLLQKKLPKYNYDSFIKYSQSAVGLGILSKIKIKETKHLDVKFRTKFYRPILETTFSYENIEFKIFNNHWPSKAVAESYRVKYAKSLQDRLIKLPKDYDYILLGDFNSNYNEFETFKKSQKLNNTRGITGINQILNTILEEKYITYNDILEEGKKVHYNLWLDISSNERFSTKFRNENNTPDNILIPSSLFDNKKLSYVPKSFTVFKPNYLYKDNEIIRWKMSDDKFIKKHKAEGFSDHLPIFANFSINEEDRNPIEKIQENQEELSTIADLYKEEKLTKPLILNDVIVIYKEKEKAIIKKQNDRAIYIYKDAEDLKLGFLYNLQINQIKDYNGLKEIINFVIVDEKEEFNNYKNLYLNAEQIDVFDPKYENEIITNLKGKIKNSRLYLDENKYIKLYSKNKNLIPDNNDKTTILNAQLAPYKGNMQIIIHKQTDYKIGE